MPDISANDVPVALTVAGSDSGAGAGVQADLATMSSLGVHGVSVLTCVTAQNPKEVLGVQLCDLAMIRNQLVAVQNGFRVSAMKTGMLAESSVIHEFCDWLEGQSGTQKLVVDPVMVSTSGRSLLAPEAVDALKKRLLPKATLITPNLPEAEALTGRSVSTEEQMKEAAACLADETGAAVLLKGGHLSATSDAVDVFHSDEGQELLTSRRLDIPEGVHGTGCTLSAAVTALLARGLDLRSAVMDAKVYITEAIEHRRSHSGHSILGWSWAYERGE